MRARLNIKSEGACRLVSRLSGPTGDSLASVGTKALHVEFERQETPSHPTELW
jgi:hypothetical protein